VATRTQGAVELIESGETGLLVPIGDIDQLTETITGLLRDHEKRVRLGQAAQQAAVTRFSVERMIAETEEIYRSEIG
jgi:glycosyltransferase involved in cell wall biosynthesis